MTGHRVINKDLHDTEALKRLSPEEASLGQVRLRSVLGTGLLDRQAIRAGGGQAVGAGAVDVQALRVGAVDGQALGDGLQQVALGAAVASLSSLTGLVLQLQPSVVQTHSLLQ